MGNYKIMLQRSFNDIMSSRGQITGTSPTDSNSITLASAFLARGSNSHIPLSDFISCVTTAGKKLRFPSWNEDGKNFRNRLNFYSIKYYSYFEYLCVYSMQNRDL